MEFTGLKVANYWEKCNGSSSHVYYLQNYYGNQIVLLGAHVSTMLPRAHFTFVYFWRIISIQHLAQKAFYHPHTPPRQKKKESQ